MASGVLPGPAPGSSQAHGPSALGHRRYLARRTGGIPEIPRKKQCRVAAAASSAGRRTATRIGRITNSIGDRSVCGFRDAGRLATGHLCPGRPGAIRRHRAGCPICGGLDALRSAEPVATTTRHCFFREFSGITPVLLARYRRWPRADGPWARAVPGAGPGARRRPSRDTLPCPQRSAPWAPRPGVHGRRKDCLVTTPEAEPRTEARRAPVRFSVPGGNDSHRPYYRDHRRWLPVCAG